MTVYFCDRCGKRVWREDSQMHIITISDPRAHRERNLDICAECIDEFWKELPRNNGVNMITEQLRGGMSMGIYLPNMEMPNLGYREIRIYPDGRVMEENECGINEVVGTAVLVPPHVRLIDADALCNRLEKAGKIKPYLESGLNVAISFALTAPTIIPADTILENKINIIDTKGKSNYDPKHRFVISTEESET